MSFWRKEVIDPALDHETVKHIAEQRAWILREPSNAEPYYNLAQLYRMQWKQDEALGLLLEAVRLDPRHAGANVALAEIYAIRKDYAKAWLHAHAAEQSGDESAVDLLRRHAITNPNS